PAVLALLLVFAGLGGKDTSLSDGLESAFKKEADKYIETLEKQQAKPEDLAALREYIDQTTPLLISIFPGFLIVCSLVAAVLNYLAVRYLRLKFYSGVYFQNADVSRWVLPDGMVWLLIFAVGSQFLGEGLPRTVGLNGALVLVTLYFFQGLAIVLHILKAKAFPRFVWVIVFALIALQPMMMGLVIGIGLFDIWLDFRKVRTTTPPLPKE
nr:DUF2232 domain-containing protein [Nitrospinaceae bacterium]NIR55072.1 DUF2232 domain-containing protein [Nitrospinaceae bacterium]NIS85481.1 DUF2232 domain-containing protein [Nitrospinaceae bacterium]NIT82319.1 DUF2232 domain-containing protein [Nitrospinaceae bacterium]NIU44537.1 DUF2232 domain-containing protein [Nitrospinaceae bacterium]